MAKTLQDTVSEGKNGCVILPGAYDLDRPIQIPDPANGIYQFRPMPGAIFHVAKNIPLFDLSALSSLSAVDAGDLFLILEGGNLLAGENSSQLYVRDLMASAPSGLSYVQFVGRAVIGHEFWKVRPLA